jgi:probable DNA repair protein
MPDAVAGNRRYAWLGPDSCTGNSVVLTSSRRLARTLREHFNANMAAQGHAAWATPDIHFWKDWLQRRVIESPAPDSRRPLSPAASLVLWERCLRRQLDDQILSLNGLARQALAAWRALVEWQVPHEAVIRTARSRDQRAFAAAYDDYRRLLGRNAWFDPAELPLLGMDTIREAATPVPARVFACGFDRPSPLVRDLYAGLRAAGADLQVVARPPDGGMRRSVSFVDDDAELRAAGRFARDILSERPDATVGIVVSELEQDAAKVARLVREGFAPGWQGAGPNHADAVEVSYGRHLGDYPAIAAALLFLRWPSMRLRAAEVSLILRSPFLMNEDVGVIAELERRLRGLPDRDWSIPELVAALSAGEDPAGVRARLDRLAALVGDRLPAGARRSTTDLAETFDALLRRAGWPGGESPGSEEYQLVNRFRELVNEFAGTGEALGEITWLEGSRLLTRMAADTVFQPEGDGAQVQVMGPLEAAGLEFDELFVCRCDADRWPAASQPSSLLSRALQTEYDMPDATPGDTLDYARTVLARLSASAPRVTFSWSRTDLDAIRVASPLLAALDAAHDDALEDEPGWYAAGLCGLADLTVADSDPVPAVVATESVGGGAGTVNLQWREPFSAFAVGRLGVRDLEAFQPGLTPIRRGNLLHDALRRLYSDRPERAQLASMTADERSARIGAAVDAALVSVRSIADPVLGRLLDLESRRMRELLGDVVATDLARAPFAIAEVERRMEFVHAGVKLILQADRIDRLADGSFLIIDYKTGRTRNLIDRDGEPLDAQVFVYATAMDAPVGGLALLHVHRHGIAYKALGSGIDELPIHSDEWRANLDRWRRTVQVAIEAIARGDVRVNLAADRERRWQLNVLCRSAELKRAD